MTTPYTPGFTSTHDRDRLAWAAPDLLAALDKILGEISVRGSISRDDWRVESARAAIAKATGMEA